MKSTLLILAVSILSSPPTQAIAIVPTPPVQQSTPSSNQQNCDYSVEIRRGTFKCYTNAEYQSEYNRHEEGSPVSLANLSSTFYLLIGALALGVFLLIYIIFRGVPR